MTFYQRGLVVPTGLRGFLSCCYGSRNGRPSSPDTLPNELPHSDDQRPAGADAADSSDSDEEDTAAAANVVEQQGTEVEPQAPAPAGEGDFPPAVGSLEATVRLDLANRQLAVRVIRVTDLADSISDRAPERLWNKATESPASNCSRFSSVQVSTALLPARKHRHKTAAVPVDSPQFNASFTFAGVTAADASSLSLRFRLYGRGRRRRRHLIGECVVSLSGSDSGEDAPLLLPLRLRPIAAPQESDLSESCSSTLAGSVCSLGLSQQPELLLGAAYNARTGQLLLEVIKGSCMRVVGSARAPDCYTKLRLVASGRVLFKCKTRVLPASRNPTWKENFVFSVNKFQLPDISVSLTVCSKRAVGRRDVIGSFCLGASSTGDQQEHWQQCLRSQGEQVCRWHRLLADRR